MLGTGGLDQSSRFCCLACAYHLLCAKTQVEGHDELDKRDCTVAQAEAEHLRSEVSRGPNARAEALVGAGVTVATPKTEKEWQVEAERLRLEVLRLTSFINGEADSDDCLSEQYLHDGAAWL